MFVYVAFTGPNSVTFLDFVDRQPVDGYVGMSLERFTKVMNDHSFHVQDWECHFDAEPARSQPLHELIEEEVHRAKQQFRS